MNPLLTLRPLTGLIAQAEPGVWLATEPGPSFALDLQEPLVPGWWRLRLDMRRTCDAQDVRLVLRPADGSAAKEMRLPVAVNGLLDHVFRLPFAVAILELRPFPGRGTVRMGPARLDRISPWARLALMAGRVALNCWRRSDGGRLNLLARLPLNPDVALAPDGSPLERLYRLVKRRMALRSLPLSEYPLWIGHVEAGCGSPEPTTECGRTFSVVVPLTLGTICPHASLCSLRRQGLQGFEVLLAHAPEMEQEVQTARELFPEAVTMPLVDASAARLLTTAIGRARGDFIVVLLPGDELAPDALGRFAEAAEAAPSLALLYADEDRLSPDGRRGAPLFKPAWDPELLPGFNYIGPSFACLRELAARTTLPADLGMEATLYSLAMEATLSAGAERIGHVPHVLLHRRNAPVEAELDAKLLTSARNFCAAHRPGFTVLPGAQPGLRLVVPPRPESWPLVTVIIPTRDGLRVLRPCLEGLLGRTDYPHLEILVADNGSRDQETLEYLAEMEQTEIIRVLRLAIPFNWSRLNNICALKARGEVLLFLNDDVEVYEPGWLMAMVSQALRPEVGAVGALLLYPSGLVQHAGVALGLYGAAGHPWKGCSPDIADSSGSRLSCTKIASAVTGACLAVRREPFLKCGGFDEGLRVGYNDVDLCLRLGTLGLRTIWTPQATLGHHESVSRGQPRGWLGLRNHRRERRRFLKRWGADLDRDPWYNPNLTRFAEDCGLTPEPPAGAAIRHGIPTQGQRNNTIVAKCIREAINGHR